MAPKRKNFNYKSYLLAQGPVDEILVFNKEYKKGDDVKFKNVFSFNNIPEVKDDRFKNCISWNRQTIQKGDLIAMKGYFIQNGFYVASLAILSKGNSSKNGNTA